MKKVLMILAVMIAFAANVNAQDSKMAVGLTGNYGSGDSYTNYGLGAKFQYAFTENWRAEVSGDYFFKKDYISMWDVNADIHYLFNLGGSGFKLYPLAGVSLVGTSVDVLGVSTSDSKFGFNYGLGAEYPISSNLKLMLEGKGQSAENTRFIVSFGIAYTF